jgi:hypothetical protein
MLYVAGGCLGLAVFFAVTDASFLAPSGPRWQWPTGDLGTYCVAIEYFVRDAWRFPLFSIPAMGYPEGGSVIYNDAVPLAALVAKLVATASGSSVNPLPWAFLAAYVLQGVMAVRLVRALGVTRPWLVLGIASWPLLTIPFLIRFTHIALAFHGLLLWALALYFEQLRARRARVGEPALLGVVALLVNPYLFAMQLLIVGASWLGLGVRRALTWRDAGRGVVLVALWALVAAVAGFQSVPSTGSLSTGEHALFSWNLASFVIAPAGLPWSGWLGDVVRDATGGQYEGESYPGFGVLVVILLCLATRPAALGRALARHWPLCLVLVGAAAFAASERMYFGSRQIFSAELPSWAGPISGMFRSQGRFVWPLIYFVTLAPIALLVEKRGAVVTLALVGMVTTAKLVEAAPYARWARSESARGEADVINIPVLTAWMEGHERVWQFPSWWCGGVDAREEAIETMKARQVQLQLLGARLSLPNNSIYMARPLKDCAREWTWATRPALLPGTLYVLVKTRTKLPPELESIVRSPACRDEGWAHICSRQWESRESTAGR